MYFWSWTTQGPCEISLGKQATTRTINIRSIVGEEPAVAPAPAAQAMDIQLTAEKPTGMDV